MQPLPQPKHPPIPTGDKDPKTVIRKPTPARRVKKNDGNAPSTRKDEYKYLGYLNLHITDVRDESGTITEFTSLPDNSMGYYKRVADRREFSFRSRLN